MQCLVFLLICSYYSKDIYRYVLIVLGFPGGSNDEESPSMQELQVQSLGQEDPLVKEMATHSSILTWRIPWTEEPGGQQSTGSQRVGHD